VFLIDSTTVVKELKDVAEYDYPFTIPSLFCISYMSSLYYILLYYVS